ncbi:unnamed protein product [Trichobilharzia regenti]|nr:unnamed protein product [Trichobilharzia regenti]
MSEIPLQSSLSLSGQINPVWQTMRRVVLLKLATKDALSYLQQYESNLKAVLFGGSHGGYLSLHLAGRYNDDLFSAVVTRNPVTNLISMIHTSDIPDWCFTEAGLTNPGEWPLDHLLPTTNELIRLTDVSPMKYLNDTWSVPLLMLLGGKDRRVPNSQVSDFLYFHLYV